MMPDGIIAGGPPMLGGCRYAAACPVRASETFASTEYAPREGRSRSLCSHRTGEIVRAFVCVSSSTCASEPELALREDVARSDLPLPEDIVQRTDNRLCGPLHEVLSFGSQSASCRSSANVGHKPCQSSQSARACSASRLVSSAI